MRPLRTSTSPLIAARVLAEPAQERGALLGRGELVAELRGEVDVLTDVPDGELLVDAMRDREIAGLEDRVVEGGHRVRCGLARGRGLTRPRAVGAVERVEELADRVADGGVEGAAVAGQRLRHTLAVGVERPRRQRVGGVADLALELGPAGRALRLLDLEDVDQLGAQRLDVGPDLVDGRAQPPFLRRLVRLAAARSPRSPSLRDGQGTTGARRRTGDATVAEPTPGARNRSRTYHRDASGL